MKCLVIKYRLHLISSDYRDSCYVKWFGASLLHSNLQMSKPWYHCPIHIHSELCMGVHRLLHNYAKACPESCDICSNCLYSLRNSNLSGDL